MRKPRLPASPTPWPAAVLAVDPGESCGVCLMVRGEFVDSGHGYGFSPEFMDSWIERSAELAAGERLKLVLVMEKPMAGGRAFPGRNPATGGVVIGCRKLWLARWKKSAKTVSKYVVSVYHSTWRARILGMGRGGGQVLIAAERNRAQTVSTQPATAHDESVARLIALWGSRAGEVGALLPKKRPANDVERGT